MPKIDEEVCLVCRWPLLYWQDTYCSQDCEQFDLNMHNHFNSYQLDDVRDDWYTLIY